MREQLQLQLALHQQLAKAATWRRRGDYRRAGLLLTLTLGAAEAHTDVGREVVAGICNELGVLGKYTGRFDDAETFYRRALDIYLDVYGTDHDTVASIYHNLGGVAHARGQHRAGEPLARQAVEIRTRLYGPDHLSVAIDVAAWAALLDGCGRVDEAEIHLRHVLWVFRREYGDDHYEIAVTAHNLAALRHRRGDFEGAIADYTEALARKERFLGAEHPELASTLVNLGAALRALDRCEAALPHYRRAAAILRRSVAADHPTLVAADAAVVAARCRQDNSLTPDDHGAGAIGSVTSSVSARKTSALLPTKPISPSLPRHQSHTMPLASKRYAAIAPVHRRRRIAANPSMTASRRPPAPRGPEAATPDDVPRSPG